MALPLPVERLWDEMQSARAELLREAEGLSQRQADWKPSERDWSVGEIVHHLTLAEVATGKLTTKLTREAEPAGGPAALSRRPHGVQAVPGAATRRGRGARASSGPSHGKSIGELLATMRATRERSRQSIEKLASLDPRPLTFKHFRLGEIDLAQWWQLQAQHDGIHLAQLREIKARPRFRGSSRPDESHPAKSAARGRRRRQPAGEGHPARARHPARDRAGDLRRRPHHGRPGRA